MRNHPQYFAALWLYFTFLINVCVLAAVKIPFSRFIFVCVISVHSHKSHTLGKHSHTYRHTHHFQNQSTVQFSMTWTQPNTLTKIGVTTHTHTHTHVRSLMSFPFDFFSFPIETVCEFFFRSGSLGLLFVPGYVRYSIMILLYILIKMGDDDILLPFRLTITRNNEIAKKRKNEQ